MEKILRGAYKADMVAHIQSHPEDFDEFIKLALSTKQPCAWRAAWLLYSCMDKNDMRLQVYVEQMIEMLPLKNESTNREFLMILQKMKINPDLEGKLFDVCVAIWENTKLAQSGRYNALKLMLKIAKNYPELQNEITFLLDERYTESCTKGIKHSISKLMR
ncbi:MAG: hypothetical protein LBJ57_07005 [Prevotellaceae bacterium]|nr:hypothetical protein [Prevotellaceae bacterium]